MEITNSLAFVLPLNKSDIPVQEMELLLANKQLEEIYDALEKVEDGVLQKFFFQTPLEEIYETIVGVDGMERYTHEELLEYIKGLKQREENEKN